MDVKELAILFPKREVVLSDGATTVEITPLSLEDLPKIAVSFGKLLKYAEAEGDNISPSEIAAKGLEEVLKLVPYCINLPAKLIPASDVPDILEIVIEQNITNDIVGKWMSLVQKLIARTGNSQAEIEAKLKVVKKKVVSPKS